MNDFDRGIKKFKIIETQRQFIKEMLFNIGSENCLIQSDEDQWCVNQVLDHLIMTEKLGYQYINNKRKSLQTLKTAGFRSYISRRILSFVLLLPFKYKAPNNVMPKPQADSLEQMFMDWDHQRNLLKELIYDLREDLDKQLFKHPLAGRMNLIQMLDFYESHIAHHLIQIKRIRKSLNA